MFSGRDARGIWPEHSAFPYRFVAGPTSFPDHGAYAYVARLLLRTGRLRAVPWTAGQASWLMISMSHSEPGQLLVQPSINRAPIVDTDVVADTHFIEWALPDMACACDGHCVLELPNTETGAIGAISAAVTAWRRFCLMTEPETDRNVVPRASRIVHVSVSSQRNAQGPMSLVPRSAVTEAENGS